MSDLQFDRAEGTGAAPDELKCSACGQPIRDSYYEVNGQILCPRCREEVERQLSAGSSAGRFGKALVLGAAATAVGTGIYYAVLALTGYELGLIAILVGWMVGTAVKKGASGRGGWRYQALAMFLTYTSIVASYVPLLVQEYQKQNQGVVAEQLGDTLVAAKEPEKDDPTITGEGAVDSAVVAAGDTANADEGPAMNPFVALVVMLGFIYALPFLAGFENVIGIIIIGIALYEAWKINQRAQLAFAGPFKVGQPR